MISYTDAARKYLFDSRTFYFFFSLCPFSSSTSSSLPFNWETSRPFSFLLLLLPLPHLPLFFHIFVSVLRSFGRCVFCSVKILVNSNHDSRVLYRGTGTDFSLFPGLNKSLEVGCGGGRARANGGLLLLFFLGVPRWIVLLINVRGCRWNNQRMTL